MKKIKVLFMLIFILLFASCGKPKEVNMKDTEIRDGITYIKGKNKVFTGIVKSYYDNGSLREEVTLKDGKQDGISKTYYDNGNLEYIGLHKNGKLDGIFKSYYPNGKVENERYYKNGVPDGISKNYNENGKFLSEHHYKNGKMIY